MKRILSLIILVVSVLNSTAQNKQTLKADKLFNAFKYVEAIEAYEILDKEESGNFYVTQQLADCYYQIFSTEKAETYLAKLVTQKEDASNYFKYAQMLKANGKYDQAEEWMDKFSVLVPTDKRAIAHLNQPKAAHGLRDAPAKFKLIHLEGFNSPYAEFGPVMVQDQLYYASSRQGKGRDYGWTQEPYLDIYSADYNPENHSIGQSTRLEKPINTRYNEGTISITENGTTLYFSGESLDRHAGLFGKKFKKDTEGKSTINIYSAQLKEGKWTQVTTLPFNDENSNASGPALSPDGKRLYFASDRTGTYGKSDIWYVTIHEDSSFGNPVNLGPKINTEGSEMFPHWSKNNYLYFSSNGHPGLGMLDVFAAEIQDEKPIWIRNLGKPINSGKDDFSLTIDEDKAQGFFASNRDGGTGSDDIYAFKQIEPIGNVELTLQVLEAESERELPNTLVEIYNEEDIKIGEKTTNASGIIQISYPCCQSIKLIANNEAYSLTEVNIPAATALAINETMVLNPLINEAKDRVVLNPIFFDLDKHNIKTQAAKELDKLVEIMNAYPEMIIKATSHTDSRASDAYNIALSDRRAKSTAQYVISKGIHKDRIFGQGKGETELVNECTNGVPCTEAQHQANRRSEFIIVNPEACFK